jgi:hypothetical protein
MNLRESDLEESSDEADWGIYNVLTVQIYIKHIII